MAIEKSVAVLGANGRLGHAAVEAFHAAGWRVRAVTRSGKGVFPAGVEAHTADARDAASLIEATRGFGFIFNGLNPQYDEWRQKVLPMAANVVAAARANSCVHLFPGNVYNFGSRLPSLLSEATPFRGDHEKARIRIEAERMFEGASREKGVQTIVLRAGDFFGGPVRGSWFDLILTSAQKRGKVTHPGPSDLVHAWAYLPDLARAFVALAERAEQLPRFETFHFRGHDLTLDQMHAALERVTGRQLRKAGLPWPLLGLVGLVYPLWREVFRMRYLWRRPHAMVGDRLEALIGPLPHTPLEAAVADSLAALGLMATRPTPMAGVAA